MFMESCTSSLSILMIKTNVTFYLNASNYISKGTAIMIFFSEKSYFLAK